MSYFDKIELIIILLLYLILCVIQ